MGFIFCDQHPLFVTRTQVSDPWSMGPHVLLCSTLCVHSNFPIIPGEERAGCLTFSCLLDVISLLLFFAYSCGAVGWSVTGHTHLLLEGFYLMC